ncbi:hypothetical protein SLEP1_g20139 [Rubroshorea leprosula]|uniref:Uncharacterized protein n=1 Tax=Rubroshorea leprosula TaxID=152421 RepID=A0AAV5JAI9_9ROSI|nr:hypothetical protein SLEP1_g20139 [Rubroshorea leprosula]
MKRDEKDGRVSSLEAEALGNHDPMYYSIIIWQQTSSC